MLGLRLARQVDVTAVLRGLKDFAPKPWPQRFRELQAAGGRIEIRSARLQQNDTVAVANGVLSLSAAGRLDGQLRLTVANLEKFLPTLGLDQMLSQEQASPKLGVTVQSVRLSGSAELDPFGREVNELLSDEGKRLSLRERALARGRARPLHRARQQRRVP